MNYDLIKTFLSLSETKNFNRTAELLYISQPTVTMRIRQLEQYLGQTLFLRTTKGVELTAAGQNFIQYATSIFRLMNESQAAMRNYSRDSQRIAFSAPVLNWDHGPLSGKVLRYASEHPETQLELLRATSAESLSFMANKSVDCAIVYQVPPALYEYEIVPFFSEDILLVARHDFEVHPEGKQLLLSDGTPPPLIRLEFGTTANQIIEELFYSLPCTISTDHPVLHLNLIKNGMGVGLIQETLIEKELLSGEIVKIDCEYNLHPMQYKNYLIARKKHDSHVSSFIDALLDKS